METLNRRSKVVRDEPLTGQIVRVVNPATGADIDVPHFYGGQRDEKKEWVKKGFRFKVLRGASVDVDKTIAKAACHVWRFLEMADVGEVVQQKTKNDSEIVETVKDNEEVDATDAFNLPIYLDFTKYKFQETRKIAYAANLEEVSKMKKDQLQAALNNLQLPVLRQAVEDAGLTFYTINQ